MKFIKLFENFLAEYVKSDDIHNKYYSDLDKNIYDKIVLADPTSIKDKVGIYVKWLINLYKNKALKLEDLYKATEYLKTFHHFKHKLNIKDINKIKSLPELFKLVEPYLEREDFAFSNDEERKLAGQFKEVYRNNTYRIIVPLTLKASQYFGRGTEWCTTNTNEFKHYTEAQDVNHLDENCLYILYSDISDDEDDSDIRLQFQFKERQFMDIYDEGIDIIDFFRENDDIKEFFQSLFNIKPYIIGADDIIYEWCLDNNISIETDIDSIIDYDTIEEWKENEPEEYKRLLNYDIITNSFSYDENAMDGSVVEVFYFLCKNKYIYNKFTSFLEETYPNYRIISESENSEDEYKYISDVTLYI